MSQAEVAEGSGIETSEISRLEKGLGNPTIKQMERLAIGLDVPLARIVTHKETFAESGD